MALTSKIPIAVIAVIAMVGGLGTGMAASLGLGPDSPFNGGDEASGQGDEGEPVGIHDLGDFVINLAEPGGSRLLRMKLKVEATQSTADYIDTIRPRLKDDIIRWTSDQTYSSLEGSTGKDELRNELMTRVNGILDPMKVEQVYFHSFVIQ